MAPPLPSIQRENERPSPSLNPLFQLMAADLERVNALIVERMHSPVALIPQLAGHGTQARTLSALAGAVTGPKWRIRSRPRTCWR